MNEIIKTVLHPDNFGNKDLYPKTSIDQVDGLEERLNEQKAIEIKQVTLTGESGTLTEEELATLQSQEINQIVCDNEIFRLMDNQAESGYLVYGHVGVMSSKQTVKTITITISTLGWILQSSVLGNGAQLYYLEYLYIPDGNPLGLLNKFRLTFSLKDNTLYDINCLISFYVGSTYQELCIPLILSRSTDDTIRGEGTVEKTLVEKQYNTSWGGVISVSNDNALAGQVLFSGSKKDLIAGAIKL